MKTYFKGGIIVSNLKVDVRRYLLIGLGAVAVKAYSEMRYHQGQIDARTKMNEKLNGVIKALEQNSLKRGNEA